jgi:PAS domain S-box-containing protein
MTNASGKNAARTVAELRETLVDALEFAHAAYDRQVAARALAEELAFTHELSLQDLADALGVSVDSVEMILEHAPLRVHARLGMSEDGIETLLEEVGKRRGWDARGRGNAWNRLHLDSVLLRSLMNRAPVGFAVLDHDLRYVMVNRMLGEINGLPPEEHMGKTLHDIVPSVADEAKQAFERVLGTGEPILNLRLSGSLASDPGTVRTFLENVYRLSDSRGVLGVAVVVTQVSEPYVGQMLKGDADSTTRDLP